MKEYCQYGGQAVIEGVMMRGPEQLAIAVRKPDQEIVLEKREINSVVKRFPFLKWPLLRGVVALAESLVIGMQALSFSANQSLEEEEEELSAKELALSMGLALALGILLFVVAPTTLTKLIDRFIPGVFVQNLVEGVIRIGIFLLYILAISRMKDIQRVFQYHGAEHKVIHAYEAGEELTVANIQKYSTLHPRCGTSFLLIVMVVSIFLFAFLGKQVLWWRILSRLLLMPLVAGISYELIKLSGKYGTRPLVKILIGPGLMLQKLTTREPDDSQVEVAVKALEGILPAAQTT
ncbi:MAG: DUF1385 domain-containing protein, partial [Clostridia bacterium]|nr:DUF1385 domain-containing protein [Clostridia bacterium]